MQSENTGKVSLDKLKSDKWKAIKKEFLSSDRADIIPTDFNIWSKDKNGMFVSDVCGGLYQRESNGIWYCKEKPQISVDAFRKEIDEKIGKATLSDFTIVKKSISSSPIDDTLKAFLAPFRNLRLGQLTSTHTGNWFAGSNSDEIRIYKRRERNAIKTIPINSKVMRIEDMFIIDTDIDTCTLHALSQKLESYFGGNVYLPPSKSQFYLTNYDHDGKWIDEEKLFNAGYTCQLIPFKFKEPEKDSFFVFEYAEEPCVPKVHVWLQDNLKLLELSFKNESQKHDQFLQRPLFHFPALESWVLQHIKDNVFATLIQDKQSQFSIDIKGFFDPNRVTGRNLEIYPNVLYNLLCGYCKRENTYPLGMGSNIWCTKTEMRELGCTAKALKLKHCIKKGDPETKHCKLEKMAFSACDVLHVTQIGSSGLYLTPSGILYQKSENNYRAVCGDLNHKNFTNLGLSDEELDLALANDAKKNNITLFHSDKYALLQYIKSENESSCYMGEINNDKGESTADTVPFSKFKTDGEVWDMCTGTSGTDKNRSVPYVLIKKGENDFFLYMTDNADQAGQRKRKMVIHPLQHDVMSLVKGSLKSLFYPQDFSLTNTQVACYLHPDPLRFKVMEPICHIFRPTVVVFDKEKNRFFGPSTFWAFSGAFGRFLDLLRWIWHRGTMPALIRGFKAQW
jgi:hypothetical protein